MPEGIVWFPLLAFAVTAVLIVMLRRKPRDSDNNNDK